MIAATLRAQETTGIRRVNLAQDLGAITDLIELCFKDQMDSGGRATVREMRSLSRLGPLLNLLSLADDMLKGIGQGFVWVQDGRIIGNVTIFPASFPAELGRTYIIANVAVHPDYQRRGIARQLMERSLDAMQQGGGKAAVLQVEEDNLAAQHMYERLGFKSQRTWHEWRRSNLLAPPPRPLNAPQVTARPGSLWRAEYALGRLVFPESGGGLGWQRPLHEREFHRSPMKALGDFLSGTSMERWTVREGSQIYGSVWSHIRFSGPIRLTLMVHPAYRGQLEGALLNYGVRRLAAIDRAIVCEHPSDDQATSRALEQHGFTIRRTLHHMRLDIAQPTIENKN